MKSKYLIGSTALILSALVAGCTSPFGNLPISATPTTEQQALPTEAATQVPPTEAAIQHNVIPVLFPADQSGHVGDFDSSKFKEIHAIGGDKFTSGQFERPFNSDTMDTYFPYIDIIDTLVYQDDTWIYGKIILQGPDGNNAYPGNYALELDTNVNGKGDWLIVASAPASTEWTVTGVKVYFDNDKNVGNVSPAFTDSDPNGNGFESLLFDQGIGSDTDAAWVRLSPDAANTVEFAVKRTFLGDPSTYLINMWAGNSMLNPAVFDINDHYTHEQAGAADPGYEYFYPIKAVSEIDNSCKMSVGFQPTGAEPGLCYFAQQVAEGEAPAGSPGSTSNFTPLQFVQPPIFFYNPPEPPR